MNRDAQATPQPPIRVDGPTPAGGSYALIYSRHDGSLEAIEFDADDREIRRTYTAAP